MTQKEHVYPAVLAARAQVLPPVLGDVHENPDALLPAYRNRFDTPTDRALLEESARVFLDAFPDQAGASNFAQR